MGKVPSIDIRQPTDARLAEVDAACRDHGFFFLSGHGLEDLIQRTFEESERFFAEPRASKVALSRTEGGPLGWYDRELTKQFRDCKEVFDFMEADGPIGEKLNRWPKALAGFKEAQIDFFKFTAAAAELFWTDGTSVFLRFSKSPTSGIFSRSARKNLGFDTF